jgi:hypothetical protein
VVSAVAGGWQAICNLAGAGDETISRCDDENEKDLEV